MMVFFKFKTIAKIIIKNYFKKSEINLKFNL